MTRAIHSGLLQERVHSLYLLERKRNYIYKYVPFGVHPCGVPCGCVHPCGDPCGGVHPCGVPCGGCASLWGSLPAAVPAGPGKFPRGNPRPGELFVCLCSVRPLFIGRFIATRPIIAKRKPMTQQKNTNTAQSKVWRGFPVLTMTRCAMTRRGSGSASPSRTGAYWPQIGLVLGSIVASLDLHIPHSATYRFI